MKRNKTVQKERQKHILKEKYFNNCTHTYVYVYYSELSKSI